MSEALVNRILPFSSVDGPGNRSVIFLQGCNYNCLYCHNPETINKCTDCRLCLSACPVGALGSNDLKVTWDPQSCIRCDACLTACRSKSSPKGIYMTIEAVMEEINKVRPFVSGITVSGGECTLQKEFLVELFNRVHEIGLSAYVDTNGSTDFSMEPELTNAMDMAMLDIKSYDDEEHKMLTGMSNDIVLKNAAYLVKINKLYEVRTVIVPELLDNKRNVTEISRLISGLDPDIRYKLIGFRPVGVIEEMKNIPIPPDDLMEELKALAEENGCRKVIVV